MLAFRLLYGIMKRMSLLERVLLWTIRISLALLFLTPIIITSFFFFPFITGKGFFFRIVTEIMFGAWAMLALIVPAYRPKKSFIFIALSIFIGSLVLATLFGENPYHSFWSNFERMEGLITYLHLFALFLVAGHMIKSAKEWYFYLVISLVVSVFVGLYGFCEHFFYTTSEFCRTGSEGGRIFSTLGNFIYLAVYSMFHMFIAIGLFSSIKDRFLKIFFGLVFLLNFFVFILAGSRGAGVGLIVGLFTMALCFIFSLRKTTYKYLAAAMALFIIASPFIVHTLVAKNIISDSGNIFYRLGTLPIKNLTDQPRIKIWSMGLAAVRERPLFGWGPENFIIPYAKYYDPTLYGNEPWFDRVHNMSLQWLVDGGIVGFLAYLGLLGAIFLSLYRLTIQKKLSSSTAILMMGALLSYIVQNLFVFDTITNYIFFFFTLAFLHSCLMDDRKTVEKYHFKPRHSVGLAGILLATVIVIIGLNMRPIFAAHDLLGALASANKASSVQEVLDSFQKAIDDGTFGLTETRERFANLVVDLSIGQADPKLIQPLLDRAISELEKEVEANPRVAKYPLFLGKLYTIKVGWTGTGKDKAEYYYAKVKELAPNYPQIYLGLSELYLMTGEGERAVALGDEAFQVTHKSGAMFQPVLAIHVLAENYEGARTMVEYTSINAGYSVGGENDIRLLISRTLRGSHNLEGRLAFLETLYEKYDSSYIDVGLAQTYGQLGNKEKARQFALSALGKNSSLEDQINKFLKSLEGLP